MTTGHKHKELIHAWADGAIIQYNRYGDWLDCENGPAWHEHAEYRIKPEPKPDYSKFVGLYNHEDIICTSHSILGVYSSGKQSVPEEKNNRIQ